MLARDGSAGLAIAAMAGRAALGVGAAEVICPAVDLSQSASKGPWQTACQQDVSAPWR